MRKNQNKKILMWIISMVVLFQTTAVFAVEYVPLEPDAFKTSGLTISKSTTLMTYLPTIFEFGIAVAIVLALIMIIWGGIMYMTTDSWEGKSEGMAKIQNSLYGLGMALIAWLLLYTINPALVDFKNNEFLKTPTSQVK